MNENPYRAPLEMGPVPPGRIKLLSVTLTEWFGIVAFLGVLFALTAPAEQAYREAERRCKCENGLRQMSNAERAGPERPQQKGGLEGLAKRWSMPSLATAPITTACSCLIALAGFVVIATVRELWREA